MARREPPRLSLNDWLLTLLEVPLILIVFGLTAMMSKSKTAILMMVLSLLVSLPQALLLFVALQSACPGRGLIDDPATLGVVVARAVFGPGHVTYHRIVGAVLVYPLIAVGFACVFTFLGLSIDGAFKGIEFGDDRSLASKVSYLSFATLTTTGYGDIVPVHPWARSLCSAEAVIGQLTLECGEQNNTRIDDALPNAALFPVRWDNEP